jgi:Rieske Fe-S protein
VPDAAAVVAGILPKGGPTMDRRGFLEQSVQLGVLAVLAGACTDTGSITGPELNGGKDVVVTLAEYPALAQAGGIARINGVSPPLALVNEGGEVFAGFSMVCPHQGSTVRVTGSSFVCPSHGARFDANGQWTGGQPTSNLLEYPTSYDAEAGTVTVTSV